MIARPTLAARGHSRRRSGYTLIELLVASAIATLLMLALYSALDVTVTQTDIGRERVAQTDLSRAIINRMSSDLSGTLGLLPPQSGQTATDPNAVAAGTAPATATAAEGTVALLPFQAGVIGTDQQLTLFVSKVPRSQLDIRPSDPKWSGTDPSFLPPDLRRVTYYLGTSGGLCRQERPWVTATGTGDVTDLDTSNEEAEVIAPEVTKVEFDYLDGSGWNGGQPWDGGAAGTEGSAAVLGPPRAIKVTLTFTVLNDNGQEGTKKIVHVFPLRAAAGNATTSSEAP